jgi:hypothetical protein
MATKKGQTTKFSPFSFVVVGSWIRDPGSRMKKNPDPQLVFSNFIPNLHLIIRIVADYKNISLKML